MNIRKIKIVIKDLLDVNSSVMVMKNHTRIGDYGLCRKFV